MAPDHPSDADLDRSPGDAEREPGERPDDGRPSTPPAVRRVGGWGRRLLIVGVLAAAVGIIYVANEVAVTGSDSVPQHRVVVNQFPLPGAIEPRQTEVRAELAHGFDGRLVVNGVEIPENEMEGAIDPDSVSPEELRQYGIRPNNRNRVAFKPGPGKTVESLPQGEVTVTVNWWKDRQPGVDTGSLTWTFTVN